MATNDQHGDEPELCPACTRASQDLFERAPSWSAFERARDALMARCLADHRRRAEGGGA